MMEFTVEEFRKVKENGVTLYKTFVDVYCPYFKEKIFFYAHGLKHIKFKNRGTPRSEKDQFMRFKLLHLVPEILRSSHTLQGVLETKKFERIRIHSRTDTILKPVKYYEFIAVLKRNRVKVVVKQIDEGHKFFWSIIPFWGMKRATMERMFYEGFPEED